MRDELDDMDAAQLLAQVRSDLVLAEPLLAQYEEVADSGGVFSGSVRLLADMMRSQVDSLRALEADLDAMVEENVEHE